MDDRDEENDTFCDELLRTFLNPSREWLIEQHRYDVARRCWQTMASDVSSQIATRIKIASSAVVKHKNAASWTNEDLGAAGILEQYHPYTLRILQSAGQSYGFPPDDAPYWIAHWVMNSSRGFEIYEAWWHEMFRWTYGRGIEAASEEFRSRILGEEKEDLVASVKSRIRWE
jgi:hypothetical protein